MHVISLVGLTEDTSHQVGDAVEDEYTANNKYKRTWR